MVIDATATSSSVDRNHTLLPWCNINIEQETGHVLGSENQITSRKKNSQTNGGPRQEDTELARYSLFQSLLNFNCM